MSHTPDATVVDNRFEDMYRREYPGLVAVATALSGYDGEDLVHDAMVKALVNWTRVQRLERPGGWCHRVLVNLCRSRWRRRRTESRYLSRLRREEAASPGPSAETIAFWTAVRDLPERPRLAVTLFYAGDRTTAEVATILDVPEGTVRSDLTRARITLARELEL
jgi:RNA polymerase sigma-70 factor (ECF subfamily)